MIPALLARDPVRCALDAGQSPTIPDQALRLVACLLQMLRAKKLSATDTETTWATSSGGTFTEPVQRPSLQAPQVSLQVTLSRADYKLLEVLHDDVATYAGNLLRTHCIGLRKSAEHNKKVRDNATG